MIYPLPKVSPVQTALCAHCGDPGMCCRDIRLPVGGQDLHSMNTALEVLVWLATIKHADPWMGNTGLPFLPDRKDEDGWWVLQCPRLTPEGRCGDYENRPWLCRTHTPGVHWPCIMTKTPINKTDEPHECMPDP